MQITETIWFVQYLNPLLKKGSFPIINKKSLLMTAGFFGNFTKINFLLFSQLLQYHSVSVV